MIGSLRANLAAALVLSLGCVQGLLYYQSQHQQAAARSQEQHRAAAETRHASVLGVLKQRKQSLEMLSAFVMAAPSLSDSGFSLFGERLLAGGTLQAVCWTASADSAASLAAGSTALCGHFDVLEPSRVLSGEPPLIVLSAFATRDGQPGFASVIFPVSGLFQGLAPAELSEYLIATNTIQNTTAAYAHTADAPAVLRPVAELSALSRSDRFDLLRLGSVQFVYLTQPHDEAAPGLASAAVAALVLAALGVVGAMLVRSLILTREVVHREVEHRTAELSQFAYRTSHDIRGPLVSISGLCQVIREDIEDGFYDDISDNVARIEALSTRLDTLSGDILALTRADLGQAEAEPVDLGAILADIHARLADSNPGAVRVEASVQAPRVVLPRARIVQILENLISNGIKYASPEVRIPRVHTNAWLDGGCLMLTVSDNGRGIPEQFQPRLFTMFERFHPDAAPGSGLGLSIVKKHVDRLGGSIQVHSSADGTTFAVTLPGVQEAS